PFVLGVGLASWLYARHAPPGVPFLSFSLFMGAAMSITAFPVLARILIERDLLRTPVGALAITCAAVDDVTAWCLLAVVVALVSASSPHEAIATFAGTAGYVTVMLLAVRPLLGRLSATVERTGRLSP